MLTKVYGSAVFGIEATTITVEVNIDKGIGYHLVGLPDKAVSESSYRISAALNNETTLQGKLFAYRIKNNFTYSKLIKHINLDKSTCADNAFIKRSHKEIYAGEKLFIGVTLALEKAYCKLSTAQKEEVIIWI